MNFFCCCKKQTSDTPVATWATVRKRELDEEGNSLLIQAIKNNDLEEVRGLSKEERFLNTKNDEGLTPLHVAVEKGSKDMVEILVDAGAKINRRSDKGKDTALHLAVKNKDLKLVRYLCGLPWMNNEKKNSDGLTPSAIARRLGWAEGISCFRFLEPNFREISGVLSPMENRI